ELAKQHGEPHALSAAFRALAEDPSLTGQERRVLASARFAMRRESDAVTAAPRVDQITIQAGPDLFPEGETDESARLVHDSMAPLRRRLLEATGVRIPGVRVRPTDLLEGGGYRLLINEV